MIFSRRESHTPLEWHWRGASVQMLPASSLMGRTSCFTRMVLLALSLSIGVLSGCAHRVGVTPTTDQKWFREMDRNALDSDQLSERAMMYLREYDLEAQYRKAPLQFLEDFSRTLCQDRDREKRLVLAELCYLEGKRQESPTSDLAAKLFLSATVYAHSYLHNQTLQPALNPFDPRYRMACDLYNRSLAKFVVYVQERDIRFAEAQSVPILHGKVEIKGVAKDLPWQPQKTDEYLPSYEFLAKGLNNYHRDFGLGAPVIVVHQLSGEESVGRLKINLEDVYAATVYLRYEDDPCGEQAVQGNPLRAQAEVYDPLRTDSISIDDSSYPLEMDLSTPLAYMLSRRSPASGLVGMVRADAWDEKKGLYLLAPYQPDKIPVVFVHGLMSKPYTWLGMLNELMGDQEIRERYQFWFFMYPTGNPIPYSASIFRNALLEARQKLDPDGKDKAFDEMVLVGHSMGGILSRVMIQDSGDRLWSVLSKKPLEELCLPEEQCQTLKDALFFKPLPFVRRVVFIATPHRGSHMATGWIGRLGVSLIKLPVKLAGLPVALAQTVSTEQGEAQALMLKTPSSINGLRMDNPMTQALAALPMNPDVPYHSIIGNRVAGDTPGGSDGVVPYESAHLEGAQSEKIVKSGHAAHEHPLAILEVSRILKEHLREVDRQK
ncbi:hypothetical protein DSTSK_40960 [Desulforhabdus sp. TSK]|nr:hypothetical protein DSTSK_40960 [Desulforhabdus sp. TSK]